MGTNKYRKVSELEFVNHSHPFVVCSRCKEVFVNDTLETRIYCPIHKQPMQIFLTAERAESSLTPIANEALLAEAVERGNKINERNRI